MKHLLRASKPWLDPVPQTVEAAILHTVAYADVFDYPLTDKEIHRYLVGTPTSLATVQGLLSNGQLASRHLAHHQGYYTLPGRESTIETRHRRTAVAAKMWPQAVRYGLGLASLPFVRMVAVTGALTVDNVDSGDDIDYLIITEPGRLWLCRAMVIEFVVKPAARRGYTICPNYLLSERALIVREHNLFTAHEIVQMVPIAGLETYRRLCELNAWAARFLPNAYGQPRRVDSAEPVSRRTIQTLAEAVLRTPLALPLERWEMNRKVRKLSQRGEEDAEIAFCADWCKGHFESHGRLIREAFSHRLSTIGTGGTPHAA